ncbi:MAG: hypothetical protein JKY48_12775, partial [Flavobacteriales bacterium]|nr:hypothetical protein [Flavobacteriales bacterium]
DFKNVEIHQNVANISEFMQSADLVFTSAGRTTYELAILGIPSIVMAQNSREMTHFFATEKYGFLNLGLGETLDEDTILDALMTALNHSTREQMQTKMLKHDLKNGKKRVVAKIKQLINEDEIS